MKRRIDIKSVRGITVSKASEEFIIHGSDVEYDYYYLSPRKMVIAEVIAIQYKKETGKDLILAESDQKVLKNFVTSKKDKKNDPNFSAMPTTGLFSVTKEKTNQQKPTITNQQNTNKGGQSKPLLGTAKLEDFIVKKVLGRGSFGKVCLVQYSGNKQLYAMKSLKKDVLIDQDQIENTLLEKNILQTLKHPFLVDLQFCFQNDERIYLVMPFLRGGELFQHLRKVRIFDEYK